jgi:hypothetical protein
MSAFLPRQEDRGYKALLVYFLLFRRDVFAYTLRGSHALRVRGAGPRSNCGWVATLLPSSLLLCPSLPSPSIRLANIPSTSSNPTSPTPPLPSSPSLPCRPPPFSSTSTLPIPHLASPLPAAQTEPPRLASFPVPDRRAHDRASVVQRARSSVVNSSGSCGRHCDGKRSSGTSLPMENHFANHVRTLFISSSRMSAPQDFLLLPPTPPGRFLQH